MTGNEYQKLANRTAIDKHMNVNYVALGLTGEAGEVAEEIKKSVYHGHGYNFNNLKEELGDVLWYVALACTVFGFEMEEIMQVNIDKISERYVDRFTVHESVNRKERLI